MNAINHKDKLNFGINFREQCKLQLACCLQSKDHFGLVYTFQLNLLLGIAKTDLSLKFGQSYGCPLSANFKILGCKGNSIDLVYCGMTVRVGGVHYLNSEVLASLNIRVCHPLPTLTGEANSELASSSFEGGDVTLD
ncbi:hypothetical protein J6590_067847 [Homalodisca vitripennis]|nr:hypothetical protein J6590_067847 [Homalodisca vitripennis]